MNIQFHKLCIQNFQSIGEAEIVLHNRGVVTILGVNNYEQNAKSNGSGKTSIPASLFWCLYGKTPDGISNPTNRYTGERCQVSVEFTVDNSHYKVERSVKSNSQSVVLYINNNLQSARNKSDSDRMIKEDILQMPSDIFLSLIYLSQGFNSRLSVLTPAARKDRLEQLTNTAAVIEEFSNRASTGKAKLSEECSLLRLEISKRSGSIASYENQLKEYERRRDNAMNASAEVFVYEGKTYSSDSIGDLQALSAQYREKLDEAVQEKHTHDNAANSANHAHHEAKQQLQACKERLSDIKDAIAHVQRESICPTCKQHIDADNKHELLQNYRSRESELLQERERLIKELKTCEEKLQHNSSAGEQFSVRVRYYRKQLDKVYYILEKIPKVHIVDIKQLDADIRKCTETINSLEETNAAAFSRCADLEQLLAVISHCQQLITKPFRTYLLRATVEFLNARLDIYSKYLFSNESDVIRLSVDSQKLDILLGECEYASLSGGEKRRVDLAIMLAQRDLAAEVAGVSSNIIILDEIMESMDEVATQTTLNLLENQSHTASSLESMFIISHNDYAIPVDSRIVVEKGIDRISFVTEH